MVSAELDRTTITIAIDGRREQFVATGEVVRFDGFLRLYSESTDEEPAEDSEGLLLMTDDGAFINMLTHPSGGVGKLYRVTVNPRATEQQIIEMSSGVVLDDGVKTRPCVIHVVVDEPGRSVLEITLHEGRNRQIRRMCSAVGLQVVRLRRSAEGPVKLGMLQPGEYRELKKSEINALRNAAMKSAGKGESRAASPARRPGPLKKRTNSD